jgi:hypothetical protein
MATSQAQKNIVRSFVGEGPVADLISSQSPQGAAPPVPAGLILQSFFKNVPATAVVGVTASTPIPGASQAITTVANSKLRVTVMHGMLVTAAAPAAAQIVIQIEIDGLVEALVSTPLVLSGDSEVTTGSVMYQATVPVGLHNVVIKRTLANVLNVGSINPTSNPLQMLVEEISG